jgi:hypothetical protein
MVLNISSHLKVYFSLISSIGRHHRSVNLLSDHFIIFTFRKKNFNKNLSFNSENLKIPFNHIIRMDLLIFYFIGSTRSPFRVMIPTPNHYKNLKTTQIDYIYQRLSIGGKIKFQYFSKIINKNFFRNSFCQLVFNGFF